VWVDVTAIVRELVNREGFGPGSAMGFAIQQNAGTEVADFWACDGAPEYAPLLEILPAPGEVSGDTVLTEDGATDQASLTSGDTVLTEDGATDQASLASGDTVLTVDGATDQASLASGDTVLTEDGGTDVQTSREERGDTIDTIDGATDIAEYPAEPTGDTVLAVDGADDSLTSREERGDSVLTIDGESDTLHVRERDGDTVLTQDGATDSLAAKEATGDTVLAVDGATDWEKYPISVGVANDGRRALRIDAPDGQEIWLYIDGVLKHRTTEHLIHLPATQAARQWIVALEGPPALPNTPKDRITLDWTDGLPDGGLYDVYRKGPGEAEFSRQVTTDERTWTSGPLPDGQHDFQVVSRDRQGDTATSATFSKTISSAPDPPSGIEWTFNSETGTLTVSWAASPSADVATYPVRSSAGADFLDLDSAPVQDTAALSYQQVFTSETGLYVFSVHAKDAGGLEDANLTQLVAVPFENATPAMRPAVPRITRATAIDGGKITVSYLYEPRDEYNGPGAAHEGRIYWDNGTGTVDFTSPVATVAMSNPTAVAWFEWESGELDNGQAYLFVVRIATDAHPDGIETQNVIPKTATADSDQPDAVVVTGRIV